MIWWFGDLGHVTVNSSVWGHSYGRSHWVDAPHGPTWPVCGLALPSPDSHSRRGLLSFGGSTRFFVSCRHAPGEDVSLSEAWVRQVCSSVSFIVFYRSTRVTKLGFEGEELDAIAWREKWLNRITKGRAPKDGGVAVAVCEQSVMISTRLRVVCSFYMPGQLFQTSEK